MFIDRADIKVKAGNGGNGAVSFHREKYVASGGPDGGDGGRGGDIIVAADPNMSTLMDFRYRRKYAAGNGMDGGGKRCTGKDGESLVIKVPLGTVIRDKESGAIIKDISDSGTYVLCRGGNGGWGNQHFATPTRQAPRFAKPGRPGVEREVTLELKLLADVGLVGFPNVGKSTLLSVVSKAHPKIANYRFTTLFPNLGVVYAGEGSSFVMADIPGIIEGASQGAGLGHDFLRHIDRCRLLIHVVDVSGSEGRDPVSDFEAINSELVKYNADLDRRPQIVVGNKADLLEDREQAEKFREYVEKKGLEYFEISAAAHQGVKELIEHTAARLRELPPVVTYEPEYVEKVEIPESCEDLKIENHGGLWFIEGQWIERLMSSVNFGDYESRMYFDRVLRDCGLFERLESMGVKEGDTISIYDLEFEYRY